MKPFIRETNNPLITPEMTPASSPDFEVVCTFNAGVAVYQNEILLLMRVAEKPICKVPGKAAVPVLRPNHQGNWEIQIDYLDLDDSRYDFSDPRKVYDRESGTFSCLTSISHLRLARSRDGIHFEIDPAPFIRPDCELEAFGTEDARITEIDGTYYINYTAVSHHGITTALAVTKDFKTAEKKGIIFVTENRDVTIFPQKINQMYYALTRPVPRQIGTAEIWTAQSPDLYHWGSHLPLNLPRYSWDSARNGGGAVPILTDKGWLILYHGADKQSNRYSMNAALLAADNPRQVIAISKEPVLEPEAPYEQQGFYPNVVFSCGAFLKDGVIHMYYGAADRTIALARASLKSLWKAMDI